MSETTQRGIAFWLTYVHFCQEPVEKTAMLSTWLLPCKGCLVDHGLLFGTWVT